MRKELYNQLDLNLLRTLMVLSQEQNMRRASQRLFVSQPAISQSLNKLRHHFNDELFIKVPRGLKATSFCEALVLNISPHLDGLANSLNNLLTFDPATFAESIKIALSPAVLASLSGALYQALKQAAPNAIIELVSWSSSTIESIEKDDVFFGINYETSSTAQIYMQKVAQLKGQVIVRHEHPIDKSPTSPADYIGYEIASMVTPGWNDNFSLAADIMKAHDLEYKVGFRSEVVMALIDIIQCTDMYMPHTNLFPIQQYPFLRALDVEVKGKPYYIDIYSYSHLRHKTSALYLWLHDLIVTVIQAQLQLNDKQTLSRK